MTQNQQFFRLHMLPTIECSSSLVLVSMGRAVRIFFNSKLLKGKEIIKVGFHQVIMLVCLLVACTPTGSPGSQHHRCPLGGNPRRDPSPGVALRGWPGRIVQQSFYKGKKRKYPHKESSAERTLGKHIQQAFYFCEQGD